MTSQSTNKVVVKIWDRFVSTTNFNETVSDVSLMYTPLRPHLSQLMAAHNQKFSHAFNVYLPFFQVLDGKHGKRLQYNQLFLQGKHSLFILPNVHISKGLKYTLTWNTSLKRSCIYQRPQCMETDFSGVFSPKGTLFFNSCFLIDDSSFIVSFAMTRSSA